MIMGLRKSYSFSHGIRAGEREKQMNAVKSNKKFVDVQAGFWLTHKLFVYFIGLSAHTHVELPYYSKFLLIAAYLASYNPVRTDKRFFLKVTKLIS